MKWNLAGIGGAHERPPNETYSLHLTNWKRLWILFAVIEIYKARLNGAKCCGDFEISYIHFSRPLHSIYKIGLILLFKPILQIHKYIVIHIYLLYIVYFFRYIVISEAIYIIEIYISVSHCHYFSTITSSLFAQSARDPKIKRRILGY